MKLHDKDGYAIVIGCLVRVHAHKSWKGWVRRIEDGVLWVECERRAGFPRPVKPGTAAPNETVVTVVKPSNIDLAREIGNAKVVRETSEKAQRIRRLELRKKP